MPLDESIPPLLEDALRRFAPDWDVASDCSVADVGDPNHWPSTGTTVRVEIRHRTTGELKLLGTRGSEDASVSCHRGIALSTLEAYRQGNRDAMRRYLEEAGAVGPGGIPTTSIFGRAKAEGPKSFAPRPAAERPVPPPRSSVFERPAAPKPNGVAPRPNGAPAIPAALLSESIGRVLFGSFRVMDLLSVIQTLANMRRTGRLVLALRKGAGLIGVVGGNIVHAQLNDLTGESAFAALLQASDQEPDGRFCFSLGADSEIDFPATIETRKAEQLLLSVASKIDGLSEDS